MILKISCLPRAVSVWYDRARHSLKEHWSRLSIPWSPGGGAEIGCALRVTPLGALPAITTERRGRRVLEGALLILILQPGSSEGTHACPMLHKMTLTVTSWEVHFKRFSPTLLN